MGTTITFYNWVGPMNHQNQQCLPWAVDVSPVLVYCSPHVAPSTGLLHLLSGANAGSRLSQDPAVFTLRHHGHTKWGYTQTPVMLWTMTVLAMTPWTRDYHLTMTPAVWVSCYEGRHGAVRWRLASVLGFIVSYCISKVTSRELKSELLPRLWGSWFL